MTREDAIKVLKQLKRFDDTICESPKNICAVYMGIEALEQEPFNIDQYCKEHFVVMVDKDLWEKAEKALKQESLFEECKKYAENEETE